MRRHPARASLDRMRALLKAYFKERDGVVDVVLVAFLSGQHVLLVGPPGTAKSLLARTVCAGLEGARFAYYLLDKFTTPRDLFVADVAISERVEVDATRIIMFLNREGPLPCAHVVVLDELFKAGGPTLNSLLLLLNEREYSVNPGDVRRSPLITVVAASNELPGKENDELAALADRFLLRCEAPYLSVADPRSAAFVEMLQGGAPPAGPFLTLADFAGLQAAAAATPIATELLWTINGIRATLALEHGIQPSDRRYKEAIAVLRAYAFLNDHPEVRREDLAILQHVLWTSRDRDERELVRKTVLEASNDLDVLRAYGLFNDAQTLHRDAVAALDQAGKIMLLNDEAISREETLLREAQGSGERLDEIARQLEAMCDVKVPGTPAGTTIRTLMHQVHVFRRHLLLLRGVEAPFVNVAPAVEP